MRGPKRLGVLCVVVLLSASTAWSQASVWDQPERLCTALASQGFHTGAWQPLAPNSPVYRCGYPPETKVPTDPAAQLVLGLAAKQPPPPVSLTFEVSGESATRADSVSISIGIGSPEAKPEAKKNMLAVIAALYQTIGQPIPRALPQFIEKEQHYLGHLSYGTVSFFSSATKQQTLWFRLGRNPQ